MFSTTWKSDTRCLINKLDEDKTEVNVYRLITIPTLEKCWMKSSHFYPNWIRDRCEKSLAGSVCYSKRYSDENGAYTRNKIFKHVSRPCGFDGSDLKTSRNVDLSHFHLFRWAAELLKYAPKITIFHNFQPEISIILTFKPKTDDTYKFCVA